MNYENLQKIISVAIILNLVLPKILKPLATPEEVKPPNGANNLSFKSQLMHMFVHHEQVPISSSVIIAVIVFASVYISSNYL